MACRASEDVEGANVCEMKASKIGDIDDLMIGKISTTRSCRV